MADADFSPPGFGLDSHQKHCLVVEDNYFAGDIMATFLQNLGITADIAENGKAALERYLASPKRYSIIFMDLQMPEMNGYEATQLIRHSGCEGADTLPIVAMSGNPLSNLGKYGFTSCLRKPFEMQSLILILETLVID